MIRTMRYLPGGLCFASLLVVLGCGDDSGNDSGGGTGTLLVTASISMQEGGDSDIDVRVRRAGTSVLDALVRISSGRGDVGLIHDGFGVYRGTQNGYGGTYRLSVLSGTDELHGAIEAPQAAVLRTPDPTKVLDPRAEADGVVTVSWGGERAHLAWV